MRLKARTDSVAWRVVDGEAVLVHGDTSAYFGLNRTATSLWEALANGAWTADELVRGLTVGNGTSVEEARRDVDAFLHSLLVAGLATSVEDGAHLRSEHAAAFPSIVPYEPPALSPFGELEQLILSGE